MSRVQIPARYSGWPGHYNNVGCSATLKTSFELNPVTEGKQRRYFISFPVVVLFKTDNIDLHINKQIWSANLDLVSSTGLEIGYNVMNLIVLETYFYELI